MTYNEGGTFVVSCGIYIGGFWAVADCYIPAGINMVSSPMDFGWAGPIGGFSVGIHGILADLLHYIIDQLKIFKQWILKLISCSDY